jgi:hypothetical protein
MSIFNKWKPAQILRARTVFPFQKAAESEMSLESDEQVIVLEETPPKQSTERWSSIDELSSTAPVISSITKLSLEPSETEFRYHCVSFAEFLKKYGDGWRLALKIKVYGTDSGHVKVQLRDLGIVPSNYIEPTV